MKIILYTGHSKITMAGGTQRVFCDLANALASRGHEVFAVCQAFRKGLPFYPLDERVHFINLDGSGRRKIQPLEWFNGIRPFLPSACNEVWERYREYRSFRGSGIPLMKLLREVQADILIVLSPNDYLMLQPPLDIPVILSHHSNVEEFFKHTKIHICTQRKMEKLRMCPQVHLLQHSYVSGIQKIYHGEIQVIPNAVPQLEEKDLANLVGEKSQKTITMVSRLDKAKQQHLLIQAFGRLAQDYPDWKVEIYGSPNKPFYGWRLKNMIASLGLVGRVELMGNTHRPLDVLRQADIFAFPSSFEGFGLALTEAMAVGLPCMGLKTTSSVNELIVDGVNGFLTENSPEDFAAKLKVLMDDQDLRVKMGRAGHERMKQYAPEKVWDQWNELVTKVVQQHQQCKGA